MPIKYVKGDIFEAKTQTIVNTVNCKGVMGKGLALEFKRRYPEMYKQYKEACEEGRLTIGNLHLYKGVGRRRWILNFPTKNHWRFKSKLEYIEEGLKAFSAKYKEWGIKSIAFPQLGCQQGGLRWSDVKLLMEGYLAGLTDLTVIVYLYQPRNDNERWKDERKRTKKRRKVTQSNETQQRLTEYT